MSFAVGDDAMQIGSGGAGGFFGDEWGPSEMASLGRFTVTLGAVLLKNRIRSQAGIGRRLSKDGRECTE